MAKILAPRHEPYMDVCFDCEYFCNKEPYSARKDAWYNHVCTKQIKKISSKMNDGMMVEITEYEFCRYVFGSDSKLLSDGSPRFSLQEGPCYFFKEELEEIEDRSEILDL